MDVACKPRTRGPRIPGDPTRRSELVRSKKPDVHYWKFPRSTCFLVQISPDDGSFGLQAGLSATTPRAEQLPRPGHLSYAGISLARRWEFISALENRSSGDDPLNLIVSKFDRRGTNSDSTGTLASVCNVNKFGYVFAVFVLLPLHYAFDIFVLLLLHSIHGAEQCWV